MANENGANKNAIGIVFGEDLQRRLYPANGTT